MADEITTTTSIRLANGTVKTSRSPGSIQADQATARYVANVQDIGFAAHEALDLGQVATPGVSWFMNQDDTNYVEVGIDDTGTFEPTVKLLPGEDAKLRLAGAPYAKANTAAVDLEYVILET